MDPRIGAQLLSTLTEPLPKGVKSDMARFLYAFALADGDTEFALFRLLLVVEFDRDGVREGVRNSHSMSSSVTGHLNLPSPHALGRSAG